jgi:hypothetical protein
VGGTLVTTAGVLAYRAWVRTQGTVGRVKTLHTAYRVTDLAASLDVYIALGYGQAGRVDIGDGASLTMLKFPGEETVTLELVHPAGQPACEHRDRLQSSCRPGR